MNRRRQLAIAMSGGLLFPGIAATQAAGKVHRIGILLISSRADPGTARVLQPFERGLRELGYLEGRNLHIEWREAQGRLERLPGLAAELAALKVDLIVAGATDAAIAAKNATTTIPIVFVGFSDPVGRGLIKSLARPGANLTGLATMTEIIVSKRLELLREILPRASRVAVIHGPSDALLVAGMRQTSATLKIQVQFHEVRTGSDLDGAFQAIEQARAEGLIVLGETTTYVHRARIAQFEIGRASCRERV